MNDLDRAIAAARRGLPDPIPAGATLTLTSAEVVEIRRSFGAVVAALDAARGQAVAWQSIRGGRLYLSRHDAVLNGEQMVTPLYAAPPDSPCVERYGDDDVIVHWPEGEAQYTRVGNCVTGTLADTQREIIETAERRGYERRVKEAQAEAVPVGEAGAMPGTSGFTMACFEASRVPLGTKLYTAPPAALVPVSAYGKCPICGANGKSRERRPNGNDRCENGHTYPSRNAVQAPPAAAVPVQNREPTRTGLAAQLYDSAQLSTLPEWCRDLLRKAADNESELLPLIRQLTEALEATQAPPAAAVPDWRAVATDELGWLLAVYERIIGNASPQEESRVEIAYAIARHLSLDCPCAYERKGVE